MLYSVYSRRNTGNPFPPAGLLAEVKQFSTGWRFTLDNGLQLGLGALFDCAGIIDLIDTSYFLPESHREGYFQVLTMLGIDVVKIDAGDASLPSYIAFGSRVVLSWAVIPSEPDFEAYVIMWDNATGTVDQILVELGSEETQYITEPLSDETYKFALCFKDQAGNVSAVNPSYVATVTTRDTPAVPTIGALAINGNVLEIPFSASTKGLVAFSNIDPLIMPRYEYPSMSWAVIPVREFGSSGTLTLPLVSSVLRVWVCAFDEFGLLSAPTLIHKTVEDGESYTLADPPPETPIKLIAMQEASADIKLTAYLQNDDRATKVRFYEGANLLQEYDRPSSSDVIEHTYSGVDTTEYTFYVSTWSSAGESEKISVTATADGTAPTGTPTITAALEC